MKKSLYFFVYWFITHLANSNKNYFLFLEIFLYLIFGFLL
jgi:hypothetical protein